MYFVSFTRNEKKKRTHKKVHGVIPSEPILCFSHFPTHSYYKSIYFLFTLSYRNFTDKSDSSKKRSRKLQKFYSQSTFVRVHLLSSDACCSIVRK